MADTWETTQKNTSLEKTSPHFVTYANQKNMTIASIYYVAQVNNLYTNKHNKALHTLANTLLAHPTTRCHTIMNV